MKRLWLHLLGLSIIAAAVACAGSQTDSSTTPTANPGDICPLLDAGPPPICPDGCEWDGYECRKNSGVIMIDARDGGTPVPPPPKNRPAQ